METQIARRRMNVIAGHIAPAHEDVSATATHLFPMSCSNLLNSVIQRRDSKIYFARQGTSSHACFMRQTNGDQGICFQSITPSKSNISLNTRPYTSEPPVFSRPANEGHNLQNVGAEVPMFSRPKMLESCLQNVGDTEPLMKNSKYPLPVPKEPFYARPSRTNPQAEYKETHVDSAPDGFGWSPKMDVAESGSTYVITTELPGVSIRSISVAVSNQMLMVTGSRFIQGCTPFSEYHRKEILQGPYRVTWPLPTDADKDSVSAEFVDGLLQIVIPKL